MDAFAEVGTTATTQIRDPVLTSQNGTKAQWHQGTVAQWHSGTGDDEMHGGVDKDTIGDFETEHDVFDLSAYGLKDVDLANLMSDKEWAAEIDLSGLEGASRDDKLFLKSVGADDLDESNFILQPGRLPSAAGLQNPLAGREHNTCVWIDCTDYESLYPICAK